MEMVVIAIVVVLALLAVIVPLLRRGPAGADAREFASDEHDDDGVAIAATADVVPPPVAADELEREVLRYRTAVRAGTVCRRCGQANPADSAFCYECGARLPLADAKEFE